MTDAELKEIENRCLSATRVPWKSMIEGRDHTSGDSFIMTAGDDIYVSNPLVNNNQEFIANAKQDIPKLIAEIRRLRKEQ